MDYSIPYDMSDAIEVRKKVKYIKIKLTNMTENICYLYND